MLNPLNATAASSAAWVLLDIFLRLKLVNTDAFGCVTDRACDDYTSDSAVQATMFGCGPRMTATAIYLGSDHTSISGRAVALDGLPLNCLKSNRAKFELI